MKVGNAILGAEVIRTFVGQNYPNANTKLMNKAYRDNLAYMQERDKSISKYNESALEHQRNLAENNRIWQEEQARLNRLHDSYEASEQRYHEREMQRANAAIREAELSVQRYDIESRNEIARLNAEVTVRNADLDREAQLAMHSKELDQQLIMQARELDYKEQLELRKLRVQKNLAERNEELQKFLLQQGIKSKQEIERFKALALRETQILIARENAQNNLQDSMVQDALKTFPLNISPLVLLKNRPHSFTSLLRFSTSESDSKLLPDIANVYQEITQYANNPEALNIFIAPIHISSWVKNRNELNQQIWDQIYQKVETFFTNFYNRNGDHPVIIYPTAWKDSSDGGQHASETLHFFLKDMPCLVIEPRFDGNSLSMLVSGWNNGYLSTNHIRTQMSFDIDLDALIVESTYLRSKKTLSLLKKLGDKATPEILTKIKRLEQNIAYFELLGLEEKLKNKEFQDIGELNINEIFDIDFSQDLKSSASIIASIICINLAVIADIHHIQATDALPLFTKIFKDNFPDLYENRELREIIEACYEKVLIYLKSEESANAETSNKIEIERVREIQIENIKRELELIDETKVLDSIESQLIKFVEEKGISEHIEGEQLWKTAIENMSKDDIPFFQEILPNISDRRMYKRIDKRIGEILRTQN